MASAPVQSGLQWYMRQIGDSPLLSADQEKELTRQMIQRNDMASRERMIRCNLRLVVSIARQYVGRGLELPDLIAEGNVGLLRAVDRFDPENGSRFSTYAVWWIRQAIQRSLTQSLPSIRFPADVVEVVSKLKRKAQSLEAESGLRPTLDELCLHLNISARQMTFLGRAMVAVGSPRQFSAGRERSLDETLPDTRSPGPDDIAHDIDLRDRVAELLSLIDLREAAVLKMRHGLDGHAPMTLEEVGRRLGLTRERIRQIEVKTLLKLRRKFGLCELRRMTQRRLSRHRTVVRCQEQARVPDDHRREPALPV